MFKLNNLVDYETGRIALDQFAVQGGDKTSLKVTIIPREKDVTSQKSSILRVLDEDIDVNVTQVRI